MDFCDGRRDKEVLREPLPRGCIVPSAGGKRSCPRPRYAKLRCGMSQEETPATWALSHGTHSPG